MPPETPGKSKGTETVKVHQHIARGKNFFVRHVNPKFIYFDKPFFLACAVYFISLIIFAVILYFLLVDCRHLGSSNIAGANGQIKFITATRAGGADICLMEGELLTTFIDPVNGKPVLREDYCMPSEYIFGTWPESAYKGIVKEKWYKFAKKGLEWCEDALYKTAAECEKVHGGTPCPPCETGAEVGTVYKLVFEEKICPTPATQIGVTLGYIGHLEAFITILLVFCFMACRIVHQLGPNGKEGLCDAVKQQVEQAAEQIGKAGLDDAENSAL